MAVNMPTAALLSEGAVLNPLQCNRNYSATSNNVNLVHWPLMGWYTEEGTGRGCSPPRPLVAVSNVIAHPSTASVSTTVRIVAFIMVRCSAV